MKLFSLVVLFAAFLAGSCATRPVVVPDNITAAELIQRAQESSDRYRYNVALQYYEIILERFPFDIDSIIAAEYEIAFIHFKQRRYAVARTGFTSLLERYNHPDAVLLPQQFRILSERILLTIDEREAQGARSRT